MPIRSTTKISGRLPRYGWGRCICSKILRSSAVKSPGNMLHLHADAVGHGHRSARSEQAILANGKLAAWTPRASNSNSAGKRRNPQAVGLHFHPKAELQTPYMCFALVQDRYSGQSRQGNEVAVSILERKTVRVEDGVGRSRSRKRHRTGQIDKRVPVHIARQIGRPACQQTGPVRRSKVVWRRPGKEDIARHISRVGRGIRGVTIGGAVAAACAGQQWLGGEVIASPVSAGPQHNVRELMDAGYPAQAADRSEIRWRF